MPSWKERFFTSSFCFSKVAMAAGNQTPYSKGEAWVICNSRHFLASTIALKRLLKQQRRNLPKTAATMSAKIKKDTKNNTECSDVHQLSIPKIIAGKVHVLHSSSPWSAYCWPVHLMQLVLDSVGTVPMAHRVQLAERGFATLSVHWITHQEKSKLKHARGYDYEVRWYA